MKSPAGASEEIRLKDAVDLIGSWMSAVLANKFVALTLGGALGTHARYWLGRWFDEVGWVAGSRWARS